MDIATHAHTDRGRTRFWRDAALEGAWLMDAHYGAHTFERHLHDEMVVVVTEGGAGEVNTRQGTEVSARDTVWVFAAGEYHSGRVVAEAGWNYRALYLDERSLGALDAAFAEEGAGRRVVAPGLYRDAEAARLIAQAHDVSGRREAVLERQAQWWRAMGLLYDRYGGPGAARTPDEGGRLVLQRARDYIEAHFREDIRIETLCAVTGLSRFHLMRAFARRYGLPPHAYANQLRLIEAKRLLRTGITPASVAADVGFYDQSHLTRLFKRAFDLTPGQFAALGAARAGSA